MPRRPGARSPAVRRSPPQPAGRGRGAPARPCAAAEMRPAHPDPPGRLRYLHQLHLQQVRVRGGCDERTSEPPGRGGVATGMPNTLEIRNAVPLKSALARIEKASSRARALASSVEQPCRMSFARTVVFGAVCAYWQQLRKASDPGWPLRKPPLDIELSSVPEEAGELARNIGADAAKLDAMDAGYAIGGAVHRDDAGGFRAQNGAYYTPPALCEVLLDMAAEAGVDWRTARILDPACGGGAFLSPVARRMARSLTDCEPRIALKSIERRLLGFELDPFAAWLSQVFLEATLADLCHEAGTRLDSAVRVCDSLERNVGSEGFDLVVGNPPYGRIGLSPELREKFRRSLFGHANLYGVFTDLALRFARPGGGRRLCHPCEFSGRGVLSRHSADCWAGKRRRSASALSRTQGCVRRCAAGNAVSDIQEGRCFGCGQSPFISPGRDGSVATSAAGPFTLPEDPGRPWLIPRTEDAERAAASGR